MWNGSDPLACLINGAMCSGLGVFCCYVAFFLKTTHKISAKTKFATALIGFFLVIVGGYLLY